MTKETEADIYQKSAFSLMKFVVEELEAVQTEVKVLELGATGTVSKTRYDKEAIGLRFRAVEIGTGAIGLALTKLGYLPPEGRR